MSAAFMNRLHRQAEWHAAAFSMLFGLSNLSLAQPPQTAPPDAIRSLSKQGVEPVVAVSTHAAPRPATVAAIVQLAADSVALVVASEVRAGAFEVVARSKPFTLSREANFGAWVESFRFIAPDRIELSFTSRSGCARTLTTHRFVLRDGTWLVTGLDTSSPRCTGSNVELEWTESANYLTGTTIRTTLHPSKPPREVRRKGVRKPFPLLDFPPSGPESAYAEMQ
jgi:hypothetical protein